MINVQLIPTGQLMNEYRDLLLALGANRTDANLRRQADRYEEEINRRIAW